MASAIKFGTLLIPVVASVEVAGRPPSQNQVSNAVITAARSAVSPVGAFSGPTAYLGVNGFSPDGALQIEASFGGGVTALNGDGGNIIVGDPQHASTAYSSMSSVFSLQHSGEEISLGNFTSNFGYTGYSNYYDEDTQNVVAVKYTYAGGTTEGESREGYVMLTGYQRIRTSRDGAVTETMNYGNTFAYPFPEINRKHGWDVYYDAIPIPDPEEDPNEEDPDYPSTPSEPDPDHTPIYDPVPIPDMPSDGVADAGFITMYRMTFREFDDFASECFASNAWDAIKLLFSNPMDFLIGASLLPFIPEVGVSYKPKFGQFTFENAYPRISEQFVDINCGDITIKKFWGSCFDYEPYTKIQIWLPYIGYRDLPTDEVMGMTINVTYRCDCLTGDCVAFVSTGVVGETGPQIPRVLAQFYGNCAVRAPFGSESYDSAISAGIGMIGAAAGVGLGAVAGAAGLISGGGALTAGMVSQLGASSMNNVIGMKPNISRGGAAGASAGYMSIQKPYIIRRIPRQNLPEGYVGFRGYPANITSTLGDLGGGYAEVDNIQLNNIPAMETERKEIIEYLKGGVLL